MGDDMDWDEIRNLGRLGKPRKVWPRVHFWESRVSTSTEAGMRLLAVSFLLQVPSPSMYPPFPLANHPARHQKSSIQLTMEPRPENNLIT